MAKPKIPNSRKSYNALHNRVERYVALLNTVYATLNKEVATIVSMTDYDATAPFKFSDYPETKRIIQKVQREFANNVGGIVINGITAEWGKANFFQDELAKKLLLRYGADYKNTKYSRYFSNNKEALNSFLKRKDSGLSLSRKVWSMSQDYKEGLEAAISAGFDNGTSAVTLSKRISKYLKDFPKLREDYTEKFGSAIHINDCEYRAARLARTEINMAYRSAENERWKQMDFVVGFEIKRSGIGYNCPMCESLVGKYPKDFVWTGWHPNCRCYKIPILNTEDEFWEMEDKPSVNEVKDIPANFKNWLDDNEERIESAKTLPYFIKNNKKILSL